MPPPMPQFPICTLHTAASPERKGRVGQGGLPFPNTGVASGPPKVQHPLPKISPFHRSLTHYSTAPTRPMVQVPLWECASWDRGQMGTAPHVPPCQPGPGAEGG